MNTFKEETKSIFTLLQDPNPVWGLFHKPDLVLNLEKVTALHRCYCSQGVPSTHSRAASSGPISSSSLVSSSKSQTSLYFETPLSLTTQVSKTNNQKFVASSSTQGYKQGQETGKVTVNDTHRNKKFGS